MELASLVAQLVKNPPAMWETWVRHPGWEDPLEESIVTHPSVLAWRSPGPRSLEGYSSWGRRVSHDRIVKHDTQHGMLWMGNLTTRSLPSENQELFTYEREPLLGDFYHMLPKFNWIARGCKPYVYPFSMGSHPHILVNTSLSTQIVTRHDKVFENVSAVAESLFKGDFLTGILFLRNPKTLLFL